MQSRQDKCKILIGNLMLDIRKICNKPLLWKLLMGSIGAFLLSEFFKARNTSISSLKDITESFLFAKHILKAHVKSYDATKGRLTLELYPSGIFSIFMRSKAPTFEAQLAYCHNITESGHKFLESMVKRNRVLRFRVDSVTGTTLHGWIWHGIIRKQNLNEILLRNGQCELLAGNLEELSEETLRMIDEMRISETYAKLTGRGIWLDYYKKSAKVNKLDSWFRYKLQQKVLRNKRWIKRVLA